jgi:curli biogenesis system outer membrane secretion channel CsgG
VDVVGTSEAMGVASTNEAMIAMFTEALANDGRFIVVERTALGAVQGEQQLGAQNAVVKETAAQSGQLLGAGILIRATVTKFEANAGGGGLQIGGLPSFGRLAPTGGITSQQALVEISLRIIDTTTGQVIGTAKAEGRASQTRGEINVVDQRTGATIGTNAFRASPLGKASQAAIASAVQKIALGVAKVPWSAQVVEAEGGRVYVSFGADQNIGPGAILQVYRKGRQLTDPTTGQVLETLMDQVGALQVQEVRDRVSTALVLSGAPARGDIVKLQ